MASASHSGGPRLILHGPQADRPTLLNATIDPLNHVGTFVPHLYLDRPTGDWHPLVREASDRLYRLQPTCAVGDAKFLKGDPIPRHPFEHQGTSSVIAANNQPAEPQDGPQALVNDAASLRAQGRMHLFSGTRPELGKDQPMPGATLPKPPGP